MDLVCSKATPWLAELCAWTYVPKTWDGHGCMLLPKRWLPILLPPLPALHYSYHTLIVSGSCAGEVILDSTASRNSLRSVGGRRRICSGRDYIMTETSELKHIPRKLSLSNCRERSCRYILVLRLELPYLTTPLFSMGWSIRIYLYQHAVTGNHIGRVNKQ